jgi:hypothetical protein
MGRRLLFHVGSTLKLRAETLLKMCHVILPQNTRHLRSGESGPVDLLAVARPGE